MKKLYWFQLIALNLLVALCILLPFLPGGHDKLSLGLSLMAQLTGFIGLPLVPVGVLWLIQEVRKGKGKQVKATNWSNGYYYAVAATCVSVLIFLFFVLCLLVSAGPSAAIILLGVMVFACYRLMPALKAMRHAGSNAFYVAPLYLLTIPLVAFAVRMCFIEPVSNYSRDYAIRNGQTVIRAIEDYHARNHQYPASMDELYDLPHPSVMGVDRFQYERNGQAYNLSFVQWQHVGATREVVMYNKNDEHNVKGHFASYTAGQPHWKYYWLD